jgi:hypothetical protein
MTIREYVEKRRTLIGRVQLLWAVVMISGSPGLIKLPLIVFAIAFVLWMAVMVAIAPLMRLLTKCPRCHGLLLQPIFRKMIPTPETCPHCGVSVDEPMNRTAYQK